MTRAKARRWGGVTLALGALAVTGWLAGQERVSVPLILERVPLRALLPGIAAILATYPLLDWYPGFAEMLVREQRLRPWRVVVAAALFAAAVLPGILAGARGTMVVGELVVALAFLALGLSSVVAAGDLGGLVLLTATFVVLFLNSPPVEPVTRAGAAPAGLVLAVLWFLSAAVAYSRLGPLRRRLPLPG